MKVDNDEFQSIPTKKKKLKVPRRVFVSNLPDLTEQCNNNNNNNDINKGNELALVPILIELFATKANVEISSNNIELFLHNNNQRKQGTVTTNTKEHGSSVLKNKYNAYITINDISSSRFDEIIQALKHSKVYDQTIFIQRDRSCDNSYNTMSKNNPNGSIIIKGKGGWAKPKETIQKTTQHHPLQHQQQQQQTIVGSESKESLPSSPISVEQVQDKVFQIVSNEFKEHKDDDLTNTTLATMAAVCLVSSTGFGIDPSVDEVSHECDTMQKDSCNNNNNNNSIKEDDDKNNNDEDEHPNVTSTKDVDFFSRMNKQSLSDLLQEFGEQDVEWKKITPIDTTTTPTHVGTGTNNDIEQQILIPKYESMLLGYGSAPVHIELMSFGYRHGIPSNHKNGWTYSHPLPPFDCRHLAPVPKYLEWMDGLSGPVKSTLLRAESSHNNNKTTTTDSKRRNNSAELAAVVRSKNDGINYFVYNVVAVEVGRMIQDAITIGGHGYSLPLRMVIYIGSETGRHRSVVCSELVATAIRKQLRKNIDNRFNQPCSVRCNHRELVMNNNNSRRTTSTTDKRGGIIIKKKGVPDVFDESV